MKDVSTKGTIVLKNRRRVLWEEQQGFCWHCSRSVPSRESTLEHLHPRSHGGTDEYENLVMSCQKCNLRRGTKKTPQKTPELLAAVIAKGLELEKAGLA